MAVVADFNTPITSIFEILMGYLSPSDGQVQANYQLTGDQLEDVNAHSSRKIGSRKLDLKLDKMSKVNFRNQIFYAEPIYPMFSTSIRENIFPTSAKMKEHSYMKLYEFLTKYSFENKKFKDTGFETKIDNSNISPKQRKLMFLCQLLMSKENLILLDRVEFKMDQELYTAFEEVMEELASF